VVHNGQFDAIECELRKSINDAKQVFTAVTGAAGAELQGFRVLSLPAEGYFLCSGCISSQETNRLALADSWIMLAKINAATPSSPEANAAASPRIAIQKILDLRHVSAKLFVEQ
jgi:hypothetical protein